MINCLRLLLAHVAQLILLVIHVHYLLFVSTEWWSEFKGINEYSSEDVASVWKSAHINVRFSILLCNRIFHCRVRYGQCCRNRTLWPSAWTSRYTSLRRTIQNRIFLLGHGLRYDFHCRILTAIVRSTGSLQIRTKCDEYHRRGGYSAVLHWTGHHRQRWCVWCIRNVTSVPCVSYIQIFPPFTRIANFGLHTKILRFGIGFLGIFAGNGHYHICNGYVLRWEKCWRNEFHIDSGSILVHHCNDDNVGVSSTSNLPLNFSIYFESFSLQAWVINRIVCQIFNLRVKFNCCDKHNCSRG